MSGGFGSGAFGQGPSPKGAAAQDLLSGLMADGDITPKGEEAPELPDAKAPKGKKDKKDAVAMMKALKMQQNAKKQELADAEAQLAAEEALRNVDIADAGPYGQACLDTLSASATAHVRRHVDLAQRGFEKVSDGTADIPAVHTWAGSVFYHAAEAAEAAAATDITQAEVSKYAYKDSAELGTFPYGELAGGRALLPAGVNPRLRETYLSDAEFCQVFGVGSRAEYYKMPKLKRDKLKQAKQLDFTAQR